jgi:hypothetical protein
MTSGSHDQTPSEREPDASEREPEASERTPGQGDHPAGQHERYGPLSLLRTRKGDGRALLLFSHFAEERDR